MIVPPMGMAVGQTAQLAGNMSSVRSALGDRTYKGTDETGAHQYEYDLDSEYDLYHFGDQSFSPKQFGKLDPYEEEYLRGLKEQALGRTKTAAQRQIEQSTQRMGGAMQGMAASRQARNAASALRSGRQGAEMVYAQGQEMLGLQKEQDMQQGADAFRQAALGKISGAGMQRAQQSAAQRAAGYQMGAAGVGAGAAILAALIPFFSDKRLKSNVSEKKGEKELRDMLSKMNAANYDMGGKNESGIIAQDLERSKAGQEMVRRGPAGLRMIDPAETSKKMLAAMALMHEDNENLKARLAKLEGKKGKKR